MRITDVKVRNYRSLHKIELSHLGDLVVIIGKNNSGKSSILEILNRFFAEIDITGVTQGIDTYTWFDGDQDSPIIVEVTIALDDTEYSSIFPAELTRLVEGKVKDPKRLTITRNIEKPPTGWRTSEVSWGQFRLMQDGKVSNPDAFAEISAPHKFKTIAFTSGVSKDNVTGDAIVLVDPEKKAYLFGPYAAALLKSGKSDWENISSKTTDWKKYAQENGYALVDRPLTENELWSLSPFSQQVLQAIISSATAKMKSQFKLVLATRDAWPQNSLIRAPLIDGETQTLLRTIGVGESRAERHRWNKIKSLFDKSFGIDLGIHPSYIAGEQNDLRLPIQNFGGGSQAFLTLLKYLTEGNFIFGIEEPEIHLHPELAQRLFEILRALSLETQIFLSTHSTIFVDKTDLSNAWMVKLRGKETEVNQIAAPDDLRRLLFELGSRPSDIFFANGLIFVEGESDKAVFPIWANTMGLDVLRTDVSWFPTHGKSRGKYHLSVWIEAAETTDLPYFMILDKDAEREAKEFIGKNLIKDKNLFLLRKGELESYYPKDKFAAALTSEYGIVAKEAESLVSNPDYDKIGEAIAKSGKNPSGWKTIVGKSIAEGMTVDDIDDEIKRVLERLATVLRRKQP